jgi:hypothetical protein
MAGMNYIISEVVLLEWKNLEQMIITAAVSFDLVSGV